MSGTFFKGLLVRHSLRIAPTFDAGATTLLMVRQNERTMFAPGVVRVRR